MLRGMATLEIKVGQNLLGSHPLDVPLDVMCYGFKTHCLYFQQVLESKLSPWESSQHNCHLEFEVCSSCAQKTPTKRIFITTSTLSAQSILVPLFK